MPEVSQWSHLTRTQMTDGAGRTWLLATAFMTHDGDDGRQVWFSQGYS